MIFIRIAGVEVIAGIFHHNGLFAILTEGKLSKVHDGHNIVVKAGVGMWILGKLRQFRTLHIVPLDLHEALAIWSGQLGGHSHAVKHLVNRSATIVATGDLQVQLLIPCQTFTRFD